MCMLMVICFWVWCIFLYVHNILKADVSNFEKLITLRYGVPKNHRFVSRNRSKD